MEMKEQRQLEKSTLRERAQTPDKAFERVYDDALAGPLISDYLKAMHLFKDEMDEEPNAEDYQGDLKQVSADVSPLSWDSNTVVLEVFRVL